VEDFAEDLVVCDVPGGINTEAAATLGVNAMDAGSPMLGNVIPIVLSLSMLLASGCGRRDPHGGPDVLRGRGLIQRCEGAAASKGPALEAKNHVVAPSPQLEQRVKDVRNGHGRLGVAYSADGTRAVVHPRSNGAGRAPLWLLTDRDQEQMTVGMPPDIALRVLWTPDSEHVLVFPARYQAAVLTITCLSLAEDARPKLHTSVGPPGSGDWSIGPFSPDSSVLFAIARETRAQLWTIAVPSCEFSLLYTQPPVRFPPRWERDIARRGPAAYPACDTSGKLDHLVPSPSGKLLLFHSYPPDNSFAQALWVVDLRTKQARLVTWETREHYYHFPVEWEEDDSCFIFMSATGAELVQYYKLTLDPGLWQRDTSDRSQ